MASAAATNAVSTEILAAQRLYYNMDPSPAAAAFLVISSQLLGFGIAGLLRSILVQPTRYVMFLQIWDHIQGFGALATLNVYNVFGQFKPPMNCFGPNADATSRYILS